MSWSGTETRIVPWKSGHSWPRRCEQEFKRASARREPLRSVALSFLAVPIKRPREQAPTRERSTVCALQGSVAVQEDVDHCRDNGHCKQESDEGAARTLFVLHRRIAVVSNDWRVRARRREVSFPKS